ncbi:FMN-binding negative transcriptional regulator [Mesohalobacter halotolerans]|uniref:FMN-binding negative transcriptional regulator n=1 Tax=Mesohalobacter halotolerans TaxID=1883405 RepID=A0A4V6ALD7_9FLAO|nr:FMN-binding negative transcriptional regulator [Mesohalobacter halotolerans]MBS3738237.1 FMN-binding negative transcriptional regulator [Psychroflexus sp.]TKS56315.1 FMN-binding negative transcriptional regulator [Mesohalobacter halotolerans]
MYTPKVYKHDNIEDIKQFISDHGFGILLNQTGNKIVGTHIPLEIDKDEFGNDILFGHISKANPQCNTLKNDSEVLAIFNGPHAYVSSSWYEKEDAPTWNYIAVHIYGKIRLIDDNTLVLCLEKLVDKYERPSEEPISVQEMSKETLGQIRGILGFYIEINKIESTYKLSQDKNAKDFNTIIANLKKRKDFPSKTVIDYMTSLRK